MQIHVTAESGLPDLAQVDPFDCYIYKVRLHHEIRQCLLKWEYAATINAAAVLDGDLSEITRFGIDTPPESIYDIAIDDRLRVYGAVKYWWDGKPKPVAKHKCDFDPRLLAGGGLV